MTLSRLELFGIGKLGTQLVVKQLLAQFIDDIVAAKWQRYQTLSDV